MAKSNAGPSKAQPCQKLPAGQFNANGQSQGKATGAVRKTADASQGKRGK